MSSPLTTAKRHAARAIQRAGRSGLGQRIHPETKRRSIDLVKGVLGERAFQTRDEAQLLRGARTRRLALTVAVPRRASGAFGSRRLTVVADRARAWRGLTHLDALVASPPPADESLIARTVREARHHVHQPYLSELTPLRVDPGTTVAPLPEGITPLGFDRDDHASFVTLVAAGTRPHRIAAAPPGWDLSVVAQESLPDPLKHVDRWRRRVQAHVALLDHADHWKDPLERANALVRVAGAGVPVVIADPDTLRAQLAPLLPAPVLDALAAPNASALCDGFQRERAALAQWSAVHDHHGLRGTWNRLLVAGGRCGLPQPSVSVVMATKRPETVPLWAHQMAAQQGVEVECVVAFHGDAFTSAHEQRAASILGDRLTVVRVGGGHRLGDALNAATRAASGDLIVKWDDDDLYDRHHVASLIRTHEYSGATVVGKAAEFIHLAGPDVTVRRDQGRRETFSATVAGGTLCIGRGDLSAVGGWQRSPRRVDSLLIGDILAAGGLVYRAVGAGYVMRRAAAGAGHTWPVSDDSFLDPRFHQRRGLDLAFAGVDVPADALAVVAP